MAADEPRPDFVSGLVSGVDHFNRGEFWEAHEAWEELWLEARSDAAEFLQGIIQIAAAYHHLKRGTLPGAVRLIDAGIARVERYAPLYCGIDRKPLLEAARRHQSWAATAIDRCAATSQPLPSLAREELPVMRLNDDWRQRVPPSPDW